MTAAFWFGLAFIFLGAVAIVLILIARADEGYQDSTGYHPGPLPSDREVQP